MKQYVKYFRDDALKLRKKLFLDDDILELDKAAINASNNTVRLIGSDLFSSDERRKLIRYFTIREAQSSSIIEDIRIDTRGLLNNNLTMYGDKQFKEDHDHALGLIAAYNLRYYRDRYKYDLTAMDRILPTIKHMHKVIMCSEGDRDEKNKPLLIPGKFRTTDLCMYSNYMQYHFPDGKDIKYLMKEYADIIDVIFNLNNVTGARPFRDAVFTHGLFEIIHPYPDGNGRCGRLLIQSMMSWALNGTDYINSFSNQLLNKKEEYFDKLSYLSDTRKGDSKEFLISQDKIPMYKSFVLFMLQCIKDAADDDADIVKAYAKYLGKLDNIENDEDPITWDKFVDLIVPENEDTIDSGLDKLNKWGI